MTGDVEAEQFLFERQRLALGPRRVGVRRACNRRRRQIAEKRDLPSRPIAVRGGGGRQRLLDAGEQLGAPRVRGNRRRPAFTRLSMIFRFAIRESRRLQKSSSEVKSPPRSRSAIAEAIAPSPTFLIAASP